MDVEKRHLKPEYLLQYKYHVVPLKKISLFLFQSRIREMGEGRVERREREREREHPCTASLPNDINSQTWVS